MSVPAAAGPSSINRASIPVQQKFLNTNEKKISGDKELVELTNSIKSNPEVNYDSILIDHKKVPGLDYRYPVSGYEVISEDVFKDFCEVLLLKNPKIETFEFYYLYDAHTKLIGEVLKRCNITTANLGIITANSLESLKVFFDALKKIPDTMTVSVTVHVNFSDHLYAGQSFKLIENEIAELKDKKNIYFHKSNLAAPVIDEFF